MQNLEPIRRISHFMRGASWLALLCLGLVWVWLGVMWDDWVVTLAHQTGLPINPHEMGAPQQLLVMLILLLPFGVMAYGLWRLQGLFGLYGRGVFFARANIQALLAFAATLVVVALLTPVVSALLSVALTWNNPPGQRALQISFGSQQWGLLLIGGTFWVIAWIMREAKKIADENAEII